ncbi:hypothetical protein CCB80_07565 [Armatimonadetes bacterium Uphvl-Ar1]|nr:hypothetical protein CCB80_07565 [Armatimonadetes bacterium Uphvl-Ar1]
MIGATIAPTKRNMKFVAPILVLSTLALVACGGSTSGGAFTPQNAVLIIEKTASQPVTTTMTRGGLDFASEPNPCSKTANTWCTFSSTSTQEEFNFELSHDKTPYRIYFQNTDTVFQEITVKIYISGLLRLNKKVNVPSGGVAFQGAGIS